jgi:hypothetical protein
MGVEPGHRRHQKLRGFPISSFALSGFGCTAFLLSKTHSSDLGSPVKGQRKPTMGLFLPEAHAVHSLDAPVFAGLKLE